MGEVLGAATPRSFARRPNRPGPPRTRGPAARPPPGPVAGEERAGGLSAPGNYLIIPHFSLSVSYLYVPAAPPLITRYGYGDDENNYNNDNEVVMKRDSDK